MRIRSIKPEFWHSDDIAALDWDARLIFVGLWSYVDDNGVGRDNEKLIVADLFPLEDDPREALARLSRGLQALENGGQIVRYEAEGRRLLFIAAWDRHQKIDRPSKGAEYPRPTCNNAAPDPSPPPDSRGTREGLAPGAGEQGSRGTGEQGQTPPPDIADADALVLVTADAVTVPEPTFDDFWALYPKKRDRADALKAWPKAIRKVPAQAIVDAARRLREDPNLPELTFVPNGSTWLNGEKWNNPPYPPRRDRPQATRGPSQGHHDGIALAMRERAIEEAEEAAARSQHAQITATIHPISDPNRGAA